MPLAKLFRKKPKPMTGSPVANDTVRARLAEYGDDGGAVRHVLHYAYPDRETDLTVRPAIVETLTARGFTVSEAAVGHGVVLSHFHSVSIEFFDLLTADLSAWFAERGWEYDGWECEVIAPRAANNQKPA